MFALIPSLLPEPYRLLPVFSSTAALAAVVFALVTVISHALPLPIFRIGLSGTTVFPSTSVVTKVHSFSVRVTFSSVLPWL